LWIVHYNLPDMVMINVGINDSAIFSQSSVQKYWHHYYEVHKGIKLIVVDDDRSSELDQKVLKNDRY